MSTTNRTPSLLPSEWSPYKIFSLEELGLPRIIQKLCSYQRGLVLVTGPTGSGKSTTLASMINHINETRYSHIVTIEDPIEFIHHHKNCVVNQREIGEDTFSFAKAFKKRAAPRSRHYHGWRDARP